MARARFTLPPPAPAPALSLRARLRAFLLESWPGRILCGALGLLVLD
jgi:hypothetical protein